MQNHARSGYLFRAGTDIQSQLRQHRIGARTKIGHLQSNVGLTTSTEKNARDVTLFVNGSF